jgi:hypothetical protein
MTKRDGVRRHLTLVKKILRAVEEQSQPSSPTTALAAQPNNNASSPAHSSASSNNPTVEWEARDSGTQINRGQKLPNKKHELKIVMNKPTKA